MKVPAFNPNNPHDQKVFERSEEFDLFQSAYDEEVAFRSITERNFAQLTYDHIKRKGYNKKVFYEKTLLSGKTYDRIKSNKLANPNPTLETVMAVCIGLELGITYGIQLLEAAGYKLSNSPLHCAYHQLLATCCGKDIFKCNEILMKLGFQPIKKVEYLSYYEKLGPNPKQEN